MERKLGSSRVQLSLDVEDVELFVTRIHLFIANKEFYFYESLQKFTFTKVRPLKTVNN